jgi:hydroxymethylbilane synthase
VLDERADVAVHSLKDLPTEPVEGICLAAVPERASPWDALILPAMRPPHVAAIGDLPPRARIGTGSLRRRAQLLHRRSDFEFVTVRGNVETRLRKLDEGACDALVLAEAGLDRLGHSARISMRLSPPELYPAAGQGALGVECLESATSVRQLLARLSHAGTLSAVLAERRVLARLEAGCHAPVGVSTSLDGDQLGLEAVVLSRDGKERLCAKSAGSIADAEEIGERVAEDLLRQGAGHFVSAAG